MHKQLQQWGLFQMRFIRKLISRSHTPVWESIFAVIFSVGIPIEDDGNEGKG